MEQDRSVLDSDLNELQLVGILVYREHIVLVNDLFIRLLNCNTPKT